MSPQWIPQNIQKRLLLYVLNQLSLFSEVDLPNLEEVSLNNITLRDISIDPEKAGKLPGFNLRHGKVGLLEVSTISGISGVKIDAKGVELVLSPDYDDETTASHSQFLLAQTTADLANTIMLETDNYEVDKSEYAIDSESDSEDSTPIVPSTRRRSSAISNNSTIGNVMQRAMEMALSRLQILISNLRIKLITESTDLLVEVKQVKITTVNGTRNITVDGVTIKTLRPVVPRGESETQKGGAETANKSEDEENENSSDYGDEALMNSMVFTHEEASSIYMSATSQSFGKSVASDGPVDNKQDDETVDEPPILFHMNSCDIEFDGLKAISNLEVKVGKVKLASTPTTATLVSIFEGIAKTLKVKLYQMKRKSLSKGHKKNDRFPQYSNEDDGVDSESSTEDANESEPLFNSVTIASLQVALSAAIQRDGSFVDSNGLIINLENITAKQKNELLLFGGVETVEVIRSSKHIGSKVFYFENSPNPGYERSASPQGNSSYTSQDGEVSTGDFRFEVFQNEDDTENLEITLLFAKAAFFNLDEENLGSMLKTANEVTHVFDCYKKFTDILHKIKKLRNTTGALSTNDEMKHEHLIVQTAAINVSVSVASDLKLEIGILPVCYDSIKDGLNIASITGNLTLDDHKIESYFNVDNINVLHEAREFRAFIQPSTVNASGSPFLRASNLNTSLSVSISNIEFVSKLNHLKLLTKELQRLVGSLSDKLADTQTFLSKPEKRVKLDQSNYMLSSTSNISGNRRAGIGLTRSLLQMPGSHRSSQANYCIDVASISIQVDDILPKFGSIRTDVTDIKLFKLKNDILGSIHALKTVRMRDNVEEDVLYHYLDLDASSIEVPLVTLKYKSLERSSTLEVHAQDFALEYYTHWLTLFGKDESIIEHVEEELIDTAPSKKQPSLHRFDIRLTLYNCLLGLNAGRLKCKGYLTVSKANVDFVFGVYQSHIKSSIRDIAILLVDDLKNVALSEDPKIDGSRDQTTATDILINQGYVQIGSVNLAHIGLTFNTNIDEIRRKNHELQIRDGLSIIEFKINSDEVRLDLCADSANTFTQMISDLKLPYDFDDKDKMKIDVNEDVNVLSGIDSSMFKNITESFAEMDLNEEPVSVEATSASSSGLEFEDEHFDYVSSYKSDVEGIDPLKVSINLSRVQVFLYDGYDWKDTRRAIRGAVKKIEAEQKRGEEGGGSSVSQPDTIEGTQAADSAAAESDTQSVFEETLYKSIHVSAPKTAKGNDLTKSINLGLQNDEGVSDDQKDKIDANIKRGKNYKNLKLRRSASHKVVTDLKSIDIGVVVYSTRDPRRDKTDPSMKVELLNLVELSLGNVDVYDNVQSSTWNKLLSYMNILGEREVGTSMAKVSILNVRPKPNLVAVEAIMKVSILPLRLHIDQDTLDFITRFFDFKDSRFELPLDEILYIQKFEISPIKLKVDYKPKKVDFVGLRSGRTAEFANFFILDGSKITLPRAHLFGLSGVPELMRGLGKAWAPVFQSTQVLGIVSGVSSLRSVVNIGGGFKDLYVVSRKEYQKDGRFWRSLQKGTSSFAKTTGYELVNMGVKLASGTQVLLEQGEEMLGGEGSLSRANQVAARRGSDDGSDTSIDLNEAKSRGENVGAGGNILLSSQILSKQAAEKYGNDLQFNGQKKMYSNFEFDDEGDVNFGVDKEFLNKSIFLLPGSDERDIKKLDSINESDEDGHSVTTADGLATIADGTEDDDNEYDVYALEESNEDELKEKMVSLYSNQPETFQQGLVSAYKSLGKNFKLTGKQLKKLKKELHKQETMQDSVMTVLKNSPVILIRPMIGTTEALSKALMGIGNVIDPKHMVEIKDKYRSEGSDEGR
ncbi:ATG2 [Candida theae]|uniref:Autophagy-related protein 2 n=1 Tax=Candida theae TaxID=1198502 RepID=A0AAD5FZH5_9ASCO|nr:ATG2 [Candida theae]KAI5960516.1 ATG2 [Candida theae]